MFSPDYLCGVDRKWDKAKQLTYTIYHQGGAINSPVTIIEEGYAWNCSPSDATIKFYEIVDCTIGDYTVMCVLLKSSGRSNDVYRPGYFGSHKICGDTCSSGCSFVCCPSAITGYGLTAIAIKGVVVEGCGSNVVCDKSLHYGDLPLSLEYSGSNIPQNCANINAMSNYDCRPYGMCCIYIYPLIATHVTCLLKNITQSEHGI